MLERPEMYVEAYRQMLLESAEKFFLKVVYVNFMQAVKELDDSQELVTNLRI